MKKIIFALALFSALFAFPAFAQKKTRVPSEVQTAFQHSFKHAREAKWSEKDDLYKVDFLHDGVKMSAFYNDYAQMVITTRNIPMNHLPINLQLNLTRQAEGAAITEILEVNSEEGSHYYAMVDNGLKKRVLRSYTDNSWGLFRKM